MDLLNVTPQHDVKRAIKALEKNLKPADVINSDGEAPLLKVLIHPIHWGIRSHQKEKKKKTSRYRDTHTVTFLERDKILSVTSPRAKWSNIEEVAKSRFTLYRYTKRNFTYSDIEIMMQSAKRILGTEYDYGQLLDIYINQILGYDHIIKFRWFDFAKKRMVCSVGSRTLMEDLRYAILEDAGLDPDDPGENPPMERLFDRLNPAYWSEEYIRNFHRVDVEATSPAHFANTEQFSHEYRLVLTYKMFL